MALKAWDEVCQPKEQGGLGFKRFNDINMALLSKLAWHMARDKDHLWVRLLRSKYLRGQSFFRHKVKKDASSVWRGIVSARNWIRKGACIQIGNGLMTDVWLNPWVPGLAGAAPKLLQGADREGVNSVANLQISEEGGWNEALVRRLFAEEEAEQILAIFGLPFQLLIS